MPLSGPVILAKAADFALKLHYDDFAASDGWLHQFRERYDLVFRAVSGEMNAVNMKTCEGWHSEVLQGYMKEYSPQDIFIADESALIFKSLPVKTISRTHSGEKPYECSSCPATFAIRGNLNAHLLTHTGERPHQCEECGKKFGLKGALTRHTLTHSGKRKYGCDECGQKFTQKCHLQLHIRRHTGERPYACQLCPATFTSLTALKEYTITHTGELPHKCDLCGTSFTSRGAIAQHKRIHAGFPKTSDCAVHEKRKRAPPKNRETPSPEAPITDEAAEVSTLQSSTTKEWYRQKVRVSANKVQQMKKKIKKLQQNKRRLSKRIDTSKNFIYQLKEQNLLSEKGLEVFQA
nr:zinc finger protein 678-like [Rhipicephalus microplus]